MGGIVLRQQERDLQRIVDAIIQLNRGRNNAVGVVTLRPNETTTVVRAVNCSLDSQPMISPRNAAAAAEITDTYVSAVDQGSFTITHPSNGDTRVWGWHTPG